MPSQRELVRMTGEEVAAFLAERRKLHAATLDRGGSPHLMPRSSPCASFPGTTAN